MQSAWSTHTSKTGLKTTFLRLHETDNTCCLACKRHGTRWDGKGSYMEQMEMRENLSAKSTEETTCWNQKQMEVQRRNWSTKQDVRLWTVFIWLRTLHQWKLWNNLRLSLFWDMTLCHVVVPLTSPVVHTKATPLTTAPYSWHLGGGGLLPGKPPKSKLKEYEVYNTKLSKFLRDLPFSRNQLLKLAD
jgi:hypothetical protein